MCTFSSKILFEIQLIFIWKMQIYLKKKIAYGISILWHSKLVVCSKQERNQI